MALKSTIFKAELQVSDLDRHHYHTYSLTLARHPSETDERMMMRLLAFAWHASESLAFCKGLSSEEEPDLWALDLTGNVDLWIEVGLPDERRVRKACGRAGAVSILAYGGRPVDIWWQQNADLLVRQPKLQVLSVPADQSRALAALAERSMQLSCTVQDGQAWLASGAASLQIVPQILQAGQD